MSTQPAGRTVAILIPFHHSERLDWLETAVRSVTDQQPATTHTLRVYLGIDGPLNPDIETFLADHTSLLHQTVHNPVNQGLAVMLNRMIDALQDEDYIARLDADDRALPDRFQLQIDFMEANPDIDVCGGSIIETDMQPDGYRQTIRYPLTHAEITRNFHKRSPIAHPACCFRRSVFERGHRYPTEATYNEDLGLWLQLITQGTKFANLSGPLIEFRIQPDFYRKRGYIKAVIEFRLFWESLKPMGKSNADGLYPILRFLFRLTPTPIKKLGYRSKLRRFL